jgi:hypothetical protein
MSLCIILFWIISREWWFHICAPYTSIQMEYLVHKLWEDSSYYLEHCFGLIIISLFDFFLDHLFALFFLFGRLSIVLFCLQSFDPQYSFISSNFLSLDMCICFDSFFGNIYTLRRNSHYIGLLSLFAHFGNGCQWVRSFEGLKGIGLHALVLFLSILGWVYILETPPTTLVGNICNKIQVHSHMHRLWESLLYIWWLY